MWLQPFESFELLFSQAKHIQLREQTFQLREIQTFIDSTMHDLFSKIKAPNHCLFHLLPPRRPLYHTLRAIGHGFELPIYNYKLHKQSFVTNCLFKYS